MGLLDDAIREHLDLKRRRGADPTEVEREEREVLGPVRPRVGAASHEEPGLAHEDDLDLDHEPLAFESDPWEDRHAEALADPEPRPPGTAFDHEDITRIVPAPEPYAEPEPYTAREPHAAPEPYGAREPHAAPDPYTAPEPYGAPEPHAAPEPYTAPEPYAAPEPHAAPEPYAAPEPHAEPEPHPTSELEPAPFAPVEREPTPQPYRADPGYEPADTGEATAEFSIEDAEEEDETPAAKEGDEEDVLEETPDFLQDTPDHDRLWFEQRPPRDFDFDG